ncbi:ATP-grasp domain-containing protein [Propylenella binzhouense]|uniref:ATP-grasp domain-containing protein n=1 Tax=Propylenella binzhouense TaxID=2555902 RepID=A0A964T3R8_9HYPH|nr:ATP-grasp domain-containing protein [Propylenella binzhouense]MYZ47665.1 hypothetical protein [Propylenella binzhouense]
MLMLEHDAKEILAGKGVPVPLGVLAESTDAPLPDFPPPFVVKAQVPFGGRGKAGGIRSCGTRAALPALLGEMIGMALKGHPVQACRIEQAVAGAQEFYLSLSVHAPTASVAVLLSPEGGVEIEGEGSAALRSGRSRLGADAIAAEVARLAEDLPETVRSAVTAAGKALGGLFVELDALLLEINPLFVRPDGTWLAGDAKLILDDNALPRQPELAALLRARANAYADTAFKLAQGFDFVVLDPDGEIGLVTTGAGLSMKLIDELIGLGARPFNFCDIRTGQMRGDPARLILVLQAMAAAPHIRSILVNIFAGITDLAEFADLLVKALLAVPEIKVPVVVRLVGNGEGEAAAILAGSGLPLRLESDLDAAVALAVAESRKGARDAS